MKADLVDKVVEHKAPRYSLSKVDVQKGILMVQILSTTLLFLLSKMQDTKKGGRDVVDFLLISPTSAGLGPYFPFLK
jgi:hypothetical protein